MGRKLEVYLGSIGGIFGILAGISLFLLTVGKIGGLSGHSFVYGVSPVLGISDPEIIISGMCLGTVILGILGIAGSTKMEHGPKKRGAMMLFSGVAGFILISTLWIVPGIFLILGGILTLREKK